ncbi:hypothetical protein SDC9_209309 [bioreactor metagenome]|uniref:Uncharacterized protein n=1 Tax=bioreactor metagenome TaxID=1076179 RepID=A0A645JD27_9ZZZZ
MAEFDGDGNTRCTIGYGRQRLSDHLFFKKSPQDGETSAEAQHQRGAAVPSSTAGIHETLVGQDPVDLGPYARSHQLTRADNALHWTCYSPVVHGNHDRASVLFGKQSLFAQHHSCIHPSLLHCSFKCA